MKYSNKKLASLTRPIYPSNDGDFGQLTFLTNQGEIFDLGQIAEWTVSSSRANISVPATVPGGIYSDLRQVDSEIHSLLESCLV